MYFVDGEILGTGGVGDVEASAGGLEVWAWVVCRLLHTHWEVLSVGREMSCAVSWNS